MSRVNISHVILDYKRYDPDSIPHFRRETFLSLASPKLSNPPRLIAQLASSSPQIKCVRKIIHTLAIQPRPYKEQIERRFSPDIRARQKTAPPPRSAHTRRGPELALYFSSAQIHPSRLATAP